MCSDSIDLIGIARASKFYFENTQVAKAAALALAEHNGSDTKVTSTSEDSTKVNKSAPQEDDLPSIDKNASPVAASSPQNETAGFSGTGASAPASAANTTTSATKSSKEPTAAAGSELVKSSD